MRLRTALSVLPAVLPLLLMTAAPARAAVPYGDLVYVHYDGSSYNLWAVNANGTGEAALPTQANSAGAASTSSGSPELEHMPELSPDASWLAFEGRPTDGEAGVYLQNAVTGHVTVLVDAPGRVEGPTGWYRDDTGGLHLTYVRDRTGDNTDLDAWEVPVGSAGAAGVPRQLTNFPGSLMNTVVVGHTLVFDYGSTHATRDHRICTAPLVAAAPLPSTPRCLTSGYDDRSASVSPTGDIVFARWGSSREKLIVLHGAREQWTAATNKNTSTLALPTSLKRVGCPRYSPSGDRIAFAAGKTWDISSDDVYLVQAAGGTPRLLTTQAGQDYVPSWRPTPAP